MRELLRGMIGDEVDRANAPKVARLGAQRPPIIAQRSGVIQQYSR